MLKLYIISQISVNKTQNVFQKKLTIQFNTTTNKKTRIIGYPNFLGASNLGGNLGDNNEK